MRYVLWRSDISYLSLRLCEPESGASRASQPLSSGCCSLRRPPAAPLDLRSGCRDSVVSSNVNVASIAATTSFLYSDQAGRLSAGSSWRMAWPTVGPRLATTTRHKAASRHHHPSSSSSSTSTAAAGHEHRLWPLKSSVRRHDWRQVVTLRPSPAVRRVLHCMNKGKVASSNAFLRAVWHVCIIRAQRPADATDAHTLACHAVHWTAPPVTSVPRVCRTAAARRASPKACRR
jgi:hypothetical protein